MKYISLFSGIEAATVAFRPMGWRALAFAEVAPFPSAVLAHRYPDVPNVGDVTAHDWAQYRGACDLVIGGPPCQAFSVAGLRGSMSDARGNLSLAYVKVVHAIDPVWTITENVPGWLSTGDNAFGCFLAGMVGEDAPLVPTGGRWTNAGLVVGPTRVLAWRVLDAQYFGLAQRRRRVFVVSGRTGDGPRPAAVLFEPDRLRRDSPPSRQARAGVARGAAGGPGVGRRDVDAGGLPEGAEVSAIGLRDSDGQTARSLNAHPTRMDLDTETFIAHTLRGTGHDASEDGTGRGVPLVPIVFNNRGRDGGAQVEVDPTGLPNLRASSGGSSRSMVAYQCHGSNVGEMGTLRKGNGAVTGGVPFTVAPLPFDTTQITSAANRSAPAPGDPCHPLASSAHAPAIAFTMKDHGADAGPLSPTLRAGGHTGSHPNGGVYPGIASPTHGVRRLMPVEMERLQGFPDGHTAIPWRGKPADLCPDGPRAKALGNSMATTCIRWIGENIQRVNNLTEMNE